MASFHLTRPTFPVLLKASSTGPLLYAWFSPPPQSFNWTLLGFSLAWEFQFLQPWWNLFPFSFFACFKFFANGDAFSLPFRLLFNYGSSLVLNSHAYSLFSFPPFREMSACRSSLRKVNILFLSPFASFCPSPTSRNGFPLPRSRLRLLSKEKSNPPLLSANDPPP